MGYILILQQQKNKFTATGNREYKKTDGANSVQSSFKAHPLWLTLYM